ncbi:iron complex outermembrane receptor protein [Caulobacter ginsengisoli]|uniref:Iron complex outermembrane receptor protein n=1 Tax=Caulobacter ginsengisoli TaxID=400775 RepID=A0ABU0IN80_9CAUL|nr:TonB-dependent receptor [Caulobacter ginsengisoli]MDQ0463467.1 iron complex outermembrane receptor protein [Caulobacter ginsengisoli]
MLDRKFLFGTTVMVGFAAAALAAAPSAAFAQGAPPATTPPASTTTSSSDEGNTVEALVITGSRIKRTEYTSSAPIQVITAEQSTLEGLVDTTEILQQSTIASGSFQVNNQLTGFVTDGGPGANTISLRGLGATRTLVLLNGRRVGPAGTRGTVGPVDLNVIPNSIVERFEILKDGASSIYGSDAVAGVINIITKQNYDGIELNVFGNIPFEQGGETFRLSGAWGKTFDRGYINIAADYYEQKVLRRGDRDDTACTSDYEFAGGRGGARVDYANTDPGQSASDKFKCYNLFSRIVRTGTYGDLMFPDAGVTYPTAAQGNSGGPNNIGGGFGSLPIPFGLVRQTRAGFPITYPYSHQDAPAYARSSILSPVKRTSLFATGGYDLTPNAELYGELLLNRRESVQYGARQFFPGVNQGYQGNTAGWGATLGSLLPIIPLASDRSQEVNYWRAVVGVRGDIPFMDGWSYDLFYQHSDSDADYTTDIIYNDRVLATTGGFVNIQNPAILAPPTAYGAAANVPCFQPHASHNISGFNCASQLPGGINWLSADVLNGNFSAAQAAFLFAKETGNTTYTQDAFEFSITGDLFQLPAGPLGSAFGISWRKDEINDLPGLNERSGNLWGSTSAGQTKGDDTVKEVFGELEIPVFKGLPGIESFDVQLSGRYTDYDSYGSDSTYKVGLNWQISNAWRIRATKGTSFRAPALYELYLANQTSFLGQNQVDPCINYVASGDPNLLTNCAADGIPAGYTAANSFGGGSSALIIAGGGAGVLKAETSEAKTVGVIWTPSFIDLSVAVDYFEITVENEITRFGPLNTLNQCYRGVGSFPNAFCTLFHRDKTGINGNPPTFNIIDVFDGYLNVAEQINNGLDLNTHYAHEFDFGKFTLDTSTTWTFKDTQALLAGASTDQNGTTTEPDFTSQINARFDKGDWTFFWGVDLVGKQSDSGPEAFGADTITNNTRYTDRCRVGAGPIQSCTSLLGTGPLTLVPVTVYLKRYDEFTAYHDISVRKKMDSWTFQAGIQNLFDERPPSQSTGQFRIGTAAINQYDVIGRRAFIQISKKW